MRITAQPEESFVVLHLRGEFDTFQAPRLLEEVDALLAAGAARVALNLRLVRFLSSTGMGAILEASKRLRDAGGRLVVSRPSPFCREILGKVGLDRLVSIHATDEEAGRALLEDEQVLASRDAELPPAEEARVLFAPRDPQRLEHFLPPEALGEGGMVDPRHGHRFGAHWRGVGRVAGLDEKGLRFTWHGGRTGLTPFEMGQLLSVGTELEVKFRLPLLRKGFTQAVVTVIEVEERPEGVKLAASFQDMKPDAWRAVRRYMADMRLLKDELVQGAASAGPAGR